MEYLTQLLNYTTSYNTSVQKCIDNKNVFGPQSHLAVFSIINCKEKKVMLYIKGHNISTTEMSRVVKEEIFICVV